MKKRGFGVGLWNGVGGKPNKGENIKATAIRECQEEIGITPISLKEVATLNFFFPEFRAEWNQQVVTFICNKWDGSPAETEEMAPKWFDISKIPYTKMWSDDKYWLPKVLEGKYVTGDFYFDEANNLLKYKIN